MTTLCVGSLNVNNRNYKRSMFLEFLLPHQFDILCLQECSHELGSYLSKHLGMHLLYASADFAGNALLSKLPFSHHSKTTLVPEISSEKRSAVIGTVNVTVEKRNYPISFIATHLDHIEEHDRVVQWEQLQRFIPGSPSSAATLICGDFNALYREDYSISKWRDIAEVRKRTHWVPPSTTLMDTIFKTLRYRDAYRMSSTYRGPSVYPPYTCRFDTRIDWILLPPEHQEGIRCTVSSYEVVEAMHVTDHNLVKCHICFSERNS